MEVTDPETGKREDAKRIRCRNGREAAGTSCATLIRRTRTSWLPLKIKGMASCRYVYRRGGARRSSLIVCALLA
ncbi:hypothetical protein PO124_18450 [Bacillus licheniformis]|nr:hypothetical protein [Bacillus licheniformis]